MHVCEGKKDGIRRYQAVVARTDDRSTHITGNHFRMSVSPIEVTRVTVVVIIEINCKAEFEQGVLHLERLQNKTVDRYEHALTANGGASDIHSSTFPLLLVGGKLRDVACGILDPE
jgi:hypothetical protein